MNKPKLTKVLICGATGFIGRNILERFAVKKGYGLYATRHKPLPRGLARLPAVRWVKADLTSPRDVGRAIRGMDIVIQAAATTSGAKDIVERPYCHVTDNAVMNSLVFRAAYDHRVRHVVFLSCSVMYCEQPEPVRERDFKHDITPRYFGVGWTKVYLEKMCEFYSRLGPAKYTAIRHSNIYGPYDKYDLEKSHVFGATVAKVMSAKGGKITVWGDGSEERDLLYVDDLVDFVEAVLERQQSRFELINVGSGSALSVSDLVCAIIKASGRKLTIGFDRTKPSIPFKLCLNIERAKSLYGWSPRVPLAEGIRRSLRWYEEYEKD